MAAAIGTASPPREGDFRSGLALGYKSLSTSSAYELTASVPAVSSSDDLDHLGIGRLSPNAY
jgi:hypothetical protein